MADFGDLLARLTAAVVTPPAAGPLSTRLCTAVRDLSGATGAAITVAYGQPDRVTLATTDAPSARLEDLQDVIGEGPGHSAWRQGRIVVGDVPPRGPTEWELFAEAAQDVVESSVVHAVPMRPRGTPFGVITLYRVPASAAPLRLSDAQLQFVANSVGAALLLDPAAVDDTAAGPWASRAQVHQATGMVVAQLHVTPEDALALLRAHAYAHGSTLSEIAASVVERRISFPIS